MKNIRWPMVLLVLGMSLGLGLLFLAFPSVGFNAVQQQRAVRWCECVDYVRNRFGLNPSQGPWFVGAADMGPYLEAQGMTRLNAPVVGAVVVFPRTFGAGIDQQYGHVGVVRQVQPTSSGWSLMVRGARQTVPEWTEAGCSNVSDMHHILVARGAPGVAFYDPGTGTNTAAAAEAAPGRLYVTEALLLKPATPRVGEPVLARFSVQNVGGQPLLLERLTVGGRQGETWDNATLADFPYHPNVELQPGEVYTYVGQHYFAKPGNYFGAPVARINGTWQQLAGSSRMAYTVVAAQPTAPPAPGAAAPGPTATTAATTHASEPVREWRRNDYLAEGMYTFAASAGPGVRIYLETELVLDGLGEPPTPDGYSVSRTVPGRTMYEIVVQVSPGAEAVPVSIGWERLHQQ